MATLRYAYVNGARVYWETHMKRWVDAIGGSVVKFAPNFCQLPYNSSTGVLDSPFVTTITEAGAGETTVAPGLVGSGTMLITTDAAEYDGANIQLHGEQFLPVASKPIYFGIYLTASDATQSDLLAGLCITNTALLNVATSHAINTSNLTDGIYFFKADGGTDLTFQTMKDATATSTTVHTMTTSATWLEFYAPSAAIVHAYVNGVLVASHTTNIDDDEPITPSINFRAGAAAAKTLTVSQWRAIQIR